MAKKVSPLGILGSGEEVFLGRDVTIDPKLLELALPRFPEIHSGGRFHLVDELDYDFTVGKTPYVETRPEDRIVFAYFSYHRGLSRFVMGREAPCTRSLVVVLLAALNCYRLLNIFPGRKPVTEPYQPNSTDESRAFWSSHAFLWGSKPAICWCCGKIITAPDRARPIGDIVVCESCFYKAPRECKLSDFPGWGELRIPK